MDGMCKRAETRVDFLEHLLREPVPEDMGNYDGRHQNMPDWHGGHLAGWHACLNYLRKRAGLPDTTFDWKCCWCRVKFNVPSGDVVLCPKCGRLDTVARAYQVTEPREETKV